jgi:hypothetical protein
MRMYVTQRQTPAAIRAGELRQVWTGAIGYELSDLVALGDDLYLVVDRTLIGVAAQGKMKALAPVDLGWWTPTPRLGRGV